MITVKGDAAKPHRPEPCSHLGVNSLDWLVAGLIAISALVGMVRGGTRTAVGLLGWILGAVLALRFGAAAGNGLFSTLGGPALRAGLGMVLVFLVVTLTTGITGAILARLIHAVGLGSGDRLLGGVLGVMRGVALALVLAVVAGLTSLPQSPLWRTSFCGPRLEMLALQMKVWLPESVASFIRFGAADLAVAARRASTRSAGR